MIDYRDIMSRLEWAAEMFDLEEIGFDPWNSRQISVPLIEKGYTCVEIRQGVATLSEPSKKLLELVASRKIAPWRTSRCCVGTRAVYRPRKAMTI